MIHGPKLGRSFAYAFEGLLYALQNTQNFRVHFLFAIIAVIAGLFLGITHIEMVLIVITILLVLATEMLNTSIEQMTDLIVQEHRKEAKIAKDVAAGMVLLTSVGSVIVGVLIFTPYIVRLLNQ